MPQNLNISICTDTFAIGSSRNCGLLLKDHTISVTLCKIKHTQVYLVFQCNFTLKFCRIVMKLGMVLMTIK